MKRSSLLGTTVGAFDSLRVRDPPYTGSFVEVATLAGANAYDDTQVVADIAANAAAIAAPRPVVETNKVQWYNAGAGSSLYLECGTGGSINCQDAGGSALMSLASTAASVTPNLTCQGDLTVSGTLSAASLTTALNAKQDTTTWVDAASTSHVGITTINAPGSSVSAGVLTLPATSSGLTIVDGNGATQSQITQLSFAGGIATGSGLTTMSVGPSLQVYNYAGTSWVMPSKIWHENYL